MEQTMNTAARANVVDVRDMAPQPAQGEAVTDENRAAFIARKRKWHSRTQTATIYNRALYFVFDSFFKPRGLTRPTSADFEDFREWIETQATTQDGRPLSDHTRQRYFNTARMFFSWLYAEGLYSNIIPADMPGIKVDADSSKGSFSPEQVQEITAQISSPRDLAIMMLMLHRGLRCVEICRAQAKEFRSDNGTYLLRVTRKGGKIRDLEIPPDTAKAVLAYLGTRGPLAPDAPLFASEGPRRRGGRLDPCTVSRIAAKYLKGAGWKDAAHTAHSCRHTFITRMAELKIDPVEMQEMADHSSFTTTSGYINKARRREKQIPARVEAANMGRQYQEIPNS